MKKKELREQNRINMINELRRFGDMDIDSVFSELGTQREGLSIVEIEDKLDEFGENNIDYQNTNTIFTRIKDAFINPFNIVLFLVAAITFVTDVIIPKEKDYATFILIITTIIISAVISLVEELKSDNAAKKLKSMISNEVDVVRDEVLQSEEVTRIVPGDIIKLSSGDMVPGDVRIFEAKDLFVDQASLTGESDPQEKFPYIKEYDDITDMSNICFMGTNIVSGSAMAVVLYTGNNTYFGGMAKSMANVQTKNSFEKGVDNVSSLLIKMMVIMVPVVLLINLFTKSDWWNSLIFSITIAVGLTPEMLPVIMASTMAKGAVEMSKKKTIVKRLSAIQTFGQMDILCTDKTGTLTEDEIILEKYMDVKGNDNIRVLKHAFLNSYFQTGLKNLIDVAIISRAEKEGLNIFKEVYTREDEIPFDFSRRRMSVVLRDRNNKRQLITKGAVDEVISICKYIDMDGQVSLLDDEKRKEVYGIYEKYNKQGLRVLGVAQKNEIHNEGAFGVIHETDMVLMGFVGFLDPPKASAKSAIEKLRNHGIDTVVLTGDTEGVALNVCDKVGIKVEGRLTGREIDELTDDELKDRMVNCHLYSKLDPLQKQRIVSLYQEMGHTVGYMGDGINDSPPLKQADVGISVDTAVDIAKETAGIILLEKDLNVLEEGVINGRRTFTNVLKYVKLATSGNFGNMLSVIIASIILPFLPMLPIHILIQNILCDLAQVGMPFDRVDPEYIVKPKKWDTKSLMKFMFTFGAISTIFDILCFVVMLVIFKYNTVEKSIMFQTGWFAFGVISQVFIIHMLRTHRVPFVESRSSKELVISTLIITLLTLVIVFTPIAIIFDLSTLPLTYMLAILVLLVLYSITIQVYKKNYLKHNDTWL
ncbi:MAG: magnesium-translocating P-type ATPase [Clostridia bacterium]|nr:magnesium-translocating P-type ATPase [Clostridia bacterium]